MPSLQELNALPAPDAEGVLTDCCGATAWVREMSGRRPYRNAADLLRAADDVWNALDPADWLEAFTHHPRIGDRSAASSVSATARRWSANEQSAAANTDRATQAQLVAAQNDYQQRFHYIFIICAAGRSAADILAALRARLANPPDEELRIAAEEQRKIMQLRLNQLMSS